MTDTMLLTDPESSSVAEGQSSGRSMLLHAAFDVVCRIVIVVEDDRYLP